MSNTNRIIPILLIIIYGAAGLVAALAFTELMVDEPNVQPELTTRFFVIDENEEMAIGKPVSYRTIIENQEGINWNYDLKVRSAGEIVYDQQISLDSNKGLNQTIAFIPNLTSDYQKLEFLLYRNNELYRTRVFQVSLANYGLKPIEMVAPISPQNSITVDSMGLEPTDNYNIQLLNGIIMYSFKTGEKLELRPTNEIVSKEDAIYTTASKGRNIIFLGETYEKTLPNSAKFLTPVIVEDFNKTLKINENLELKNGYMVTLIQMDKNAVKFRISRNNKKLWDIASLDNSPVEYWREINDLRKEKMIRIIPREIYPESIVFDIIQYGSNKVINIENKYGEFQVTQITEDAIIMKNIQEIKIEPGKVISLANDKIRIKV
ncbi:MAG: S-layer protein domain-containing protein [Candidatus Methanoperedens sp.]|nr:S-layer protein domain-containing protein [Candidatus Methanoperedens sp.]